MSAAKTPRKQVDWPAIEPHYRAGIRSLRDIAKEFGCSDAAIVKHAEKHEWARDLKARINAKADAKVSAALVSGEVSAQTKLAEAVVVEAESTVQARIRLAHRADIASSRALALKLLRELDHQTDNGDLYEQLFDLLTDPEADADDSSAAAKERHRKRREAFERAMSLSGRTKTMKDMADTLRILVGLEREAFGIDSGEPDPGEAARNLVVAFRAASA